MAKLPFRWTVRLLTLALLLLWAGSALWLAYKRPPPGLQISGSAQPVALAEVRFLRDLAAADASGAPLLQQQIDPELLRLVAQAREFLVLDAGLFGDLPAAGPDASRLRSAPPIAQPLAEALLHARHEHPELQVLLLVDPSSAQVGAQPLLERLASGGIGVVEVAARRLRAPNPGFSSIWQLCCGWWAQQDSSGSWPNPVGVGPSSVSMGLWGDSQALLRSHRQLLIADDGNGALVGVLFSRALNAEAAIHSATALEFTGMALEPLLESEFVVAQFSGWSGGELQARSQRLLRRMRAAPALPNDASAASARAVSEQAIEQALLQRLQRAQRRDSVDIAALYLAQRDVVRTLLEAAHRGVAIRVLLDPNKDGYGYRHSGIPNREVATELVAASDGAVRVRWYRTHGEQFSPGLVLIRSASRSWLMVGTAEFTRRDLDDFDLTAAVIVDMPLLAGPSVDAASWFDSLWFNRAASGTEYTSDADVYADASQLNYWQYRVQEACCGWFD